MDEHPRGGRHYPRSTGEFQSWFATDADCLDYLAWLRWPQGFVCPRCQNPSGWAVAGGAYKCASCLRHTAVTADTLFDRRRTPLTVWFAACWQFATAKDGISALGLQRTLEIGSYQTAWAMLHRLRSVLVRPVRVASSKRLVPLWQVSGARIRNPHPSWELKRIEYDNDHYQSDLLP